jgi:hypothetical protein
VLPAFLSFLQAALSSKDEEVRKASEEKALLERRLHNLEKLILRGDTQASGNMRVSTPHADRQTCCNSCGNQSVPSVLCRAASVWHPVCLPPPWAKPRTCT